MKFTKYFIFLFGCALLLLPSCLGNNDNISKDYTEWYTINQEYIDSCELVMENGSLAYERVVPNWDQSVFVLMRWYNDRSETVNLLTPLSNSTITVKYTLTNIAGDTLDSSSSFECQPNNMITGFWTAVTHMHEKDTITAVIPYDAGYGSYGSGSVLPYSTLIFGIRLDSINKLF